MSYEHGVVLGVPTDALVGGDYAVNATLQAQEELRRVHGRPVTILSAQWLTTTHPEEVDDAPRPTVCHPGCTCAAGRNAAKKFLALHPDYAVLMGVVTFDFLPERAP